MPNNVREYRVFVSSPSGLERERDEVRNILDELSQVYEGRGIRIVPWLWENDARSEFGKPAQTIINGQVGSYDIYLGLMGIRFGSPTEMAGSGTEEEFERALEARRTGHVIQVSFLFKNVEQSVSALSVEDTRQLLRVKQFRERIGPEGLYEQFEDLPDLSTRVRKIISKAVEANLGSAPMPEQRLASTSQEGIQPQISKAFFDDTLNSLGEDLVAGAKVRVTLSDVWVSPILERSASNADAQTTRGKRPTFNSLVTSLTSGKSTLVYGADTCGKSSLCRRAFLDLWEAGYVPVLLEPERINSPDPDRMLQRIRTAYAAEYENLSSEDAIALPKDKKILIIDDFDRVRPNIRSNGKLLQSFLQEFKAILLSVQQSFALNLFQTSPDTPELGAFQRIEIKEFGQKTRYELIEKWRQISTPNVLDDNYFRSGVEQRRRTINRALRTNLVPRTPVMVLILLQAIDAKQASDLGKAGYVRYYKFLIDYAILRDATPQEAELTYAFLPEVAWVMYKQGKRSLDNSEMEHVVERFATDRALQKTSLYSALSFLRRVDMFDEKNSEYRFRHQYAYYFFLTDYISRNLHDGTVKTEVERMCREITVRTNADTIIFLSFHTDSTIIIDLIMRGLSHCYQDASSFEFSIKGQAHVNQLIRDLAQHVIDQTRFAKNRAKRLEQEEASDLRRRQQIGDEKSTQFTALSTSVEIVGHILRNHYARLDAKTKREILDAATRASLRCLDDTFAFFSKHLDTLLTVIRAVTDRMDQESDSEKKKDLARQIAFSIFAGFTHYVTRTLIRAIGDENLDITYQDVLKDDPATIGGYLRLAIKLDCFRDFPTDDLKAVAGALRSNYLATVILRAAVQERLDMAPPPVRDLQRICDIAGLKLKSILVSQHAT